MLNACNGGGESDDSPPPTPISIEKPVVSDSIESIYVNKAIVENSSKGAYNYKLDLNEKIHDVNNLPLKIDDYSVIGDGCKVSLNNMNLNISSNKENICSVYYKVKNIPDDINDSKYNYGVATVIFSSFLEPYLPTISKSLEVGSSIKINLKDELGSFYPDGGQLNDNIWYTEGDSKINIDPESNNIEIDAGVNSEVIQIRYGIDTLDGGVKFGIVTVTVSDDSNLSPKAKNKYIEIEASKTPIDIDVSELISDDDDNVSSLQLLKVDSFDNIATIINTEDVYNKKFQANIDKAGLFDINYIITDHHGGYASAIIRIKVNTKKYWDDITLSSGVLYTAPWEKVGADQYGLPYQSLTDYNLDGNLFNIPMFDYKSAEAVCRLRGMVIPTLQQLIELQEEKIDVHETDDWPNDKYFWSSTDGDSFDTKKVFALDNTAKVLNNQSTSTPFFLTCVLPGILSVDVTKDDSPVTIEPLSDSYDELEAVVQDVSGVGIKDSVVYLYSSDKDLMFEKQIGFTDTDGSVTFKVRSKSVGEHSVTVSYYSQKMEQLLNFVLDEIKKFEVSPQKATIDVGSSLDLSSEITKSSGSKKTVTEKTNWKITDGASIVSLSDNTVKGIKEGSATIEGTYFDSLEGKSFTNTSIITVHDVVTSVKLTPKTPSIYVDDTVEMQLTAHYKSGKEERVASNLVTWNSKKSGVAKIDNKGVVKGVSAGSSLITGTFSGQSDTATVTVKEVAKDLKITGPDKIVMDVSSTNIDTIQLESVLNSTTTVTKESSWSSSNDAIATVDSNGKVTAHNTGDVTITARYKGLSAQHSVTVTINDDIYGSHVLHLLGCKDLALTGGVPKLNYTYIITTFKDGVPSNPRRNYDFTCKGKGFAPKTASVKNTNNGDYYINISGIFTNFAIDPDSKSIMERVYLGGLAEDEGIIDNVTGRKGFDGLKCIAPGMAHLTSIATGKKMTIHCR